MAKLKQTRRSKARKRLTAEQRKYWAARGLLGVVPQKVIVEFERQLDDYIAWYSAGLRKVLSERKSASQQRRMDKQRRDSERTAKWTTTSKRRH